MICSFLRVHMDLMAFLLLKGLSRFWFTVKAVMDLLCLILLESFNRLVLIFRLTS